MAYIYQELAQLISTAGVIDAAGRQRTCGIQGADRKAMQGRYHPYGARSNCPSNIGANWDPTFAYAETVEKPSYWPGFNRLPALDFLSNELAWQTNTLSHPNTLQSIHNACSLGTGINIHTFDRTTMTPASVSEQRRLEQNHPFYMRRRKTPAEGLTRTRDKYRVVYTEQQRKGLERAYEQNKFISIKTKVELAKELDLSDRQIKIWFQNRRAKERRQKNKESEFCNEKQVPSKENSILDSISGADVGNWSPTANKGVRELPSCRFQTAQTPPTDTHFFGKDEWSLMDKKNSSQSCQSLSHSVNNRSSASVQEISPSKWPSADNGLLPYTNVSPLSFNLDIGYDPRL